MEGRCNWRRPQQVLATTVTNLHSVGPITTEMDLVTIRCDEATQNYIIHKILMELYIFFKIIFMQ